MLGDDSHEKQMLRNQMIAIGVMTLLLLVWMRFFMPNPPPVKQTPQQAEQQQAQTAPKPGEENPNPLARPSGTPAVPSTLETGTLAKLPPKAKTPHPAQDEVTLKNGKVQLVFTRVGARLKQAQVFQGAAHNNAVEELVPPAPKGTPDAEAAYPLGLTFSDARLRDKLDSRSWDIVKHDDKSVEFALKVPGFAEIHKTFRLRDDTHVIEAEVSYTDLSGKKQMLGMDQAPAYVLTWPTQPPEAASHRHIYPGVVWRAKNQNTTTLASKMTADKEGRPFVKEVANAQWVAIKTAYFVMAMRPQYKDAQARAAGNPKEFAMGLSVPKFEAKPQKAQTNQFEIYVGPNAMGYLSEAWPTLTSVQRFFSWPDIMDKFAKFMLRCLLWIKDHVVNSYGVAIIILTLIVRLLMFPLTLKQVKSMKRMQLVAPELEELRKKYADEPQVQQQKIMELYRERGVNPLGGCLPLFVQMPVFFALDRMLYGAYELQRAPFLWMKDLSGPDHLYHLTFMEHVPFLGTYFGWLNLLPILAAAVMVINMKVSPQPSTMVNPQQKLMMTIMPIGMSLMFYNLPSGLNLYILTSTALGIMQTQLTRAASKDVKVEVKKKKKKPQRKKQHFYTAAQARKKRMAKGASKGNGAKKHRAGASDGKRPKKKSSK